MKPSTRLAAFTLPELMVSLALMGALFALGQQVYGIFQSWILKATETASTAMESGLVRELLNTDFQRATAWEMQDSTQLCLLWAGGDSSVCFRRDAGGLVREYLGARDTLPFPADWRRVPSGVILIRDLRLHLDYPYFLPQP